MSEGPGRANLGARLKEEREYRGFSQEEVACYLGLSRSAISLIESGSRRLDVLELQKIAQLFGTSVQALTGESTSDPQSEQIRMVARATADLTPEDRSEVLRFAEFLRARRKEQE